MDRQQPLYSIDYLSYFCLLKSQEAKAEKEEELNAKKQPLDRKGEDPLSEIAAFSMDDHLLFVCACNSESFSCSSPSPVALFDEDLAMEMD